MKTTENIYPVVELLIKQLKQHPASKLAAILDHRMHKVAWTTGDELIEELYKVLTNAVVNESALLDLEEKIQVEQLLSIIKKQTHKMSYVQQ